MNKLSPCFRCGTRRYDTISALLYEQTEDRSEERKVLEKALTLYPSLPVFHSQFGFLDIAEGRLIRTALREDTQNVELWVTLGS